jgi:hypothetical protein
MIPGLSLLFVGLFAAAAPPCVVLHLTEIGFTEAAHPINQAKLRGDLEKQGSRVCEGAAVEPADSCLTNKTCVAELLRAADGTWLLLVELTRAGGQAQANFRLFDRQGLAVGHDDRLVRLDDLTGAPSLISPHLLDVMAPPDAAPEPPVPPPTRTPPTASDAALSSGPDPVFIGGIAATVAGGLLAVGAAAGSVVELLVIRDPSSLGPDKELASVLVPSLAVLSLVGAATAAFGVGAVVLSEGDA